MLKISYAVALYLIQKDLRDKGFLVTKEDTEYNMNLLRKKQGEYVLNNGDKVQFYHKSWGIKQYV